jgi:hypothetical protein
MTLLKRYSLAGPFYLLGTDFVAKERPLQFDGNEYHGHGLGVMRGISCTRQHKKAAKSALEKGTRGHGRIQALQHFKDTRKTH